MDLDFCPTLLMPSFMPTLASCLQVAERLENEAAGCHAEVRLLRRCLQALEHMGHQRAGAASHAPDGHAKEEAEMDLNQEHSNTS